MAEGINVAREFVRLADLEEDQLDQMRLYKLMYYAQGWSLAWYNEPLFRDEIQAWKHGPVPTTVRQRVKDTEITPDTIGKPADLTERQKNTIWHVWMNYKKYPGLELSKMTHRETPWISAYDGGQICTNTISERSLREYFGDLYTKETGLLPGGEAEIESRVEKQYKEGRTISAEDFFKELLPSCG